MLSGEETVDVGMPPAELSLAEDPQAVSKTVTVLDTKERDVTVVTDVQPYPY